MLTVYRGLFPEWSERTLARFAVSNRRLDAMGYDLEQQREVLRLVTRPNGSLNIAKLDQLTENRAALWAVRAIQ